MRILIVTFYYEPDLCAGSFRASAFIRALKRSVTANDSIDIVTTMPNRYGSFRAEAFDFERNENITIKRIKVPPHKSGLIDQAKAFLVYFINTLQFVRCRGYDVVFATSSRLFSAYLGAVISWGKDIPLYLDIRDIFVDTLRSLFGKSLIRYAIPALSLFERFTLMRADKINLVSKGFAPYFLEKYQKNYSFYTNGIDDEFLFSSSIASAPSSSERIVFTYTGNIGEGQGLERIVPRIARRYRNIEFRIIGDGGRKSALAAQIVDLPNVRLVAPMCRQELLGVYRESDVLFLHLNNYDAFKKVLPSKIFEYGAMYKPIIAGVDGYAKEFLEEYLSDSLIFRPCDVEDFCSKYERFSGNVDFESRKRFIAKFSRQNIMNEMVADFLDTFCKNAATSTKGSDESARHRS